MFRFFVFFITLILFSLEIKAQNVTIEADKINSFDNNSLITAEGSVLILYQDMVISTDKATYNKLEGYIELEKDVVFKDKTNIIRADYTKIYIDNRTGFFRYGKGFYAPWNYFKADKLEKIGENSFILDNATITTCSGDNPDWSFSSSRARIDVGQYFRSKHSFGNIRDVPIIYTPYFVWPIKKERQNGFLVPNFGFSSNRGFFITPKYFWAIDVDKDMTLGVNLFSKNGVMFLDEFRYAVSKKENIHIIGEFINDSESKSDKSDRWRLYGVGNKFFTDNLELKFNIDYVSDFRYKRDFSDYGMVDKLKDANKDKNDFITELRLNYYTKNADFSLRYKDLMQFYDNTDGYTRSNLYQKPSFQIEKYGLKIGYLKADYLLDYNDVEKKIYQYSFDNQNKTENFTYNRYNARIKIYKPFDIKIATLTPFYTQYYTRWTDFNYNLTKYEHKEKTYLNIDVNDRDASRTIYSLGYSINLNEIYKNYEHFRHSIFNTFEYIQTPYLDQSSLPSNIDFDRIDKTSEYKYTMTNYIKSENLIIKLDLIESYDTSLQKEKLRPFNKKLTLNYKNILKLGLETKYNFYTDEIEYYKNDIEYSFSKYYISFSQSYDKSITNTDNTIMGVKIGGKLENFDFEIYKKIGNKVNNFTYNVDNLDPREFYAKIIFKRECWNIGINYTEKAYTNLTGTGYDHSKERTVFVIFELRGLGGTEREVYKTAK